MLRLPATPSCVRAVELRHRSSNDQAGYPYPHVSMKHSGCKTLAGVMRALQHRFREIS